MITSIFSCGNEWKAVAAGAAVAVTGLDTIFTGFGAPPPVHWALAGVGVDAYCKGRIPDFDTKMAMCAAGGFAGGMVVRTVMR